MSIATFSPFVKATVAYSSLPCIVVGIFRNAAETMYIAIDTDGRPIELRSSELTFDWRYDPATQIWEDPNASPGIFGDE